MEIAEAPLLTMSCRNLRKTVARIALSRTCVAGNPISSMTTLCEWEHGKRFAASGFTMASIAAAAAATAVVCNTADDSSDVPLHVPFLSTRKAHCATALAYSYRDLSKSKFDDLHAHYKIDEREEFTGVGGFAPCGEPSQKRPERLLP